MSWANEFVKLDKDVHDRASVDCGEAELNTFIQTHAARHMDANISTTMLIPSVEPLPNAKYLICAFYTIAPSSIKRETLPEGIQKKLPCYPVPVFLLAQMAVHLDYQGRGLGKITLIKALEFLLHVHSSMQAYAIIVDCLNDDIANFYLKYGFEKLYRHNGRLRMFIPMETVMQAFRS